METAACARVAKNCGASASPLVFMFAASAAAAQTQELAIGQRNLACGSPAIAQRWLADGDTGERRPRWRAPVRHRGAARRPPMPTCMPWSIVRHGKLVFEQYFPGHDEPWGMGEGRHDFDATTKHDMRSVSKSVISLLVGIAIDRELIKSADEPVVKFFPDYSAVKSAGWDNITLRHLLTMSSGMQWDENRAWKDPQERRTASRQRGRSVPLCPVEADRGTAGHGLELQWRRNGPARQRHRARIGQVAGGVRARGAVRALGISDWEWMKYRNEQDRRGRRPSLAPARRRKDRPARAQQGRVGRQADRLGRNGSSNRSRRASRRSAISAGCSITGSNGGWAARCPATRT